MRFSRQPASPPRRKGALGEVALLVMDGSIAGSPDPPCPPLLRGGAAGGSSTPDDGARSSAASQSSSSGCVGTLPITPKSFSVLTRPSPKCPCHRRFTMTRGTSAFFGPVIQRASDSLRKLVESSEPTASCGVVQAARTPGKPGSTVPAGVAGLPRRKTCVAGGRPEDSCQM